MNKQFGWAVAALVLSAPAFAQTAVQSGTGVTVSSGTGLVVTPGVPAAAVTAPVAVAAPGTTTVVAPAATVAVAPATTVAVAPASTLPGAALVPAGTTETVSGNTRTIVTRYWVNVPPGAVNDPEFQRWMRLR